MPEKLTVGRVVHIHHGGGAECTAGSVTNLTRDGRPVITDQAKRIGPSDSIPFNDSPLEGEGVEPRTTWHWPQACPFGR